MTRKLGFALAALGGLIVGWVILTLTVGDPVTGWYARREQRALSHSLAIVERDWAARRAPVSQPASRRTLVHSKTVSKAAAMAAARAARAAQLRAAASAYRSSLRDGAPVGRIIVPRMGLRAVFVQGTTESDLEKGPGHYDATSGENTALPGMGGVVALAGHRTTFLQPFRHIDELQPGDRIFVDLPYGHFMYTVVGHRIVTPTDWSILKPHSYEELVMSACHPLFSASHRYVVFARLTASSLA